VNAPAPLPVAVFLSGGGTTLRNLLEKIAAGRVAAEVRLVVSSTPSAGGLRYAAEASIPTLVVRSCDHATPEAYRDAMFQPCRDAGVQLVVMGGFLKHVLIPPDFENRVVNIHPALIPAFCGQGYYGHRVHEAVLEYGAKVSGCTVHFADNHYDHGPIIMQRTVPVLDDDTPDTLAARVFEQECEAYPDAIQLFAANRLRIQGRRVAIVS
jgi:phosphoribosylglycinamide formyltransferase 1